MIVDENGQESTYVSDIDKANCLNDYFTNDNDTTLINFVRKTYNKLRKIVKTVRNKRCFYLI